MLTIHLVTVHDGARVGSCSHIRWLLPLQYPTNAAHFKVTHGTDYQRADVVVVERAWTYDFEQAKNLVRRAHEDGACLVYTTDDNLLDLEIEGAVALWLTPTLKDVIRYIASEADGVIVSTNPLKQQMAEFNDRVIVIENALDERLVRQEDRPAGRGGKCVVGYMGTATHDADLMMIAPALTEVLRRRQAEFQIVGAIADRSVLRVFRDQGIPVTVLRTGDDFEYPGFMRWLAKNAAWDVAIAPLRDNLFTRCKSDLKFLDYAAMGFPGIYSRVRPYARSVRHLETGYLAANDAAAWADGLESLLSNPALRTRIAGNARNYLRSQRTLLRNAGRWRDAIATLASTPRVRGRRAVARGTPHGSPPVSPAGRDRAGSAVVVIPGSVNYFYDRAGERIAAALRGLGWSVRVQTLQSAGTAEAEADLCLLINVSELTASCRDKADALKRIGTLRASCGRTVGVALECGQTSWFASSAYLAAEAGVFTLLDLGLHDQSREIPAEFRDVYRFCFNGLTEAERAAIPSDPRLRSRPIPWVLIGHQSSARTELAMRLTLEVAPDGLVYLPNLSPVTATGPHLNERQFQTILSNARVQVWCSHHGYFYLEGERFRNSLLTGSLPLKVLDAPPASRRVFPFEYLLATPDETVARIRDTDLEAAWHRFAEEFRDLPSLEDGIEAFLESEGLVGRSAAAAAGQTSDRPLAAGRARMAGHRAN